MLFDLRSRGRRRTVQGVYLGLAILMGGGLVLFGVGTGSGLGGLLNAFTGNGSGSNQSQAVSSAEKNALKAVRLNPNSPQAWSSLVQARFTAAGSDYNASTATFTAAGKKELTGATQAWQRYVQLIKSPSPNTAILAARAYSTLGDYAAAASAWGALAVAAPTDTNAFVCQAASAYAAKNTRVGDLASAKALSLTPKVQRTTTKTTLSAAKTSPTTAQQIVHQGCAA